MLEKATFALGPFKEAETFFSQVPGVRMACTGYTGGKKTNPTFQRPGDHAEAVELTFDPAAISYRELLRLFWRRHDPTALHKRRYMSAIFVHTEEQLHEARAGREEQQKKYSRHIVTQILPAARFYPAQDRYQRRYEKAREIVRSRS
jgi:peptide-methionine (S)-S-oxide reductase